MENKTYSGSINTQFEIVKRQEYIILSIHTYDGTTEMYSASGDKSCDALNVTRTHSIIFNNEKEFKTFCDALGNTDLSKLTDSNSSSFRVKSE